ncbi:sugar ABC transporter substrate-binding protein [Lactonifactor longoviformis]|uniref:sugar ABC transporter substrate-binding protein n=1 Tax=Lactonifactor longoviformis TaxID=341220 RepID=UPI0036F1FE07
MIKKRIISVMMAVLLVAVLAAGCGKNDSTEEPENKEGTDTAAEQEPEKKEKDTYKISALLYSRGFEFMVALDQGIQDKCKEYGIEVEVLDGNSDSSTQITQIEDSITKGVDAILLAPNNSEELVAGVKKANDAGVPVVVLDGNVAEGCEVLASCTFDNKAGGKMAAEHLMEIADPCSVLECTGATGAYHAVRRGGGFEDEMATDSSYKVIANDCSWDAETAQNATVDILSSNSEVNAVFTHNGEMVRGVIAGLKQINQLKKVGEEGHVPVVCIDGTPAELDYIRDGYLDATVEQNPFDMGALAVDVAYKYLSGEDENPEKEQYVYPRLITSDNVEDPENWANQIK